MFWICFCSVGNTHCVPHGLNYSENKWIPLYAGDPWKPLKDPPDPTLRNTGTQCIFFVCKIWLLNFSQMILSQQVIKTISGGERTDWLAYSGSLRPPAGQSPVYSEKNQNQDKHLIVPFVTKVESNSQLIKYTGVATVLTNIPNASVFHKLGMRIKNQPLNQFMKVGLSFFSVAELLRKL